jgi:hypothetical protein
MKRTIVLIVYNRPLKTVQTLEALKSCYLIEHYSLLVIRQIGCEAVENIINAIDWIPCTHIITSPPDNQSVAYKINHNVRMGLHEAFDENKSDYVVVIEDDVLLGYDFLFFSETMHARYDHNPYFRAVNAFSKEPLKADNLFSYGTFRYGIGQGWSISRNIWNQIKVFWPVGSNQHFDALVEPWFRNGFVVMPYCSRSCNIGYGGSAHSPISEFDDYYVNMRASWVGHGPFQLNPYILNNNLNYTWRSDCATFRANDYKEIFNYYKWRIKRLCKIFINYFFDR